MKKVYLIESLLSPGSYWSYDYQRFKGIIFATHYPEYPTDSAIKHALAKASSGVKITECYVND